MIVRMESMFPVRYCDKMVFVIEHVGYLGDISNFFIFEKFKNHKP